MSRWLLVLLLLSLGVISLGFLVLRPQLQSSPSASVKLEPSLQPEEPTPDPGITFLFVGDIMVDRNIRKAASLNSNDFILAPIRDFLAEHDFVVSNLEGPITSSSSRSLGSAVGSANNFSFTFDPSWGKTLHDNNLRIVNLGNNHILNFGVDGLEETLKILKENNIAHFGYTGAQTNPPLSVSYILEYQNQSFGFVNYNQFAEGSAPAALAEIKKIRPEVDWLIVYTHWDNEYQSLAHNSTVALAHQMIDLGADLIIGSHPHVIQNHEVYNNKHIYYSLGNFVFDQYFEPAVRHGLAVSIEFKPNTRELAIKETSTYLLKNGQTSLTLTD